MELNNHTSLATTILDKIGITDIGQKSLTFYTSAVLSTGVIMACFQEVRPSHQRENLYTSKMVYLLVPNPGINPSISGLAFLNPEILELENGPGVTGPSFRQC